MSWDVVFESASLYKTEMTPIPTPVDPKLAERDIVDEDRLRRMFEKSLITTRLSGPQEPLSDQSTSRPSQKLDKGKTKMPKYEDLIDNESIHSLEVLDIPIIQTNGAKKAIV